MLIKTLKYIKSYYLLALAFYVCYSPAINKNLVLGAGEAHVF